MLNKKFLVKTKNDTRKRKKQMLLKQRKRSKQKLLKKKRKLKPKPWFKKRWKIE